MVRKIFKERNDLALSIINSFYICMKTHILIFTFADSVARMSYSQTMHPKESLISQGLSNKSIFLKNHDEYM